MTRFLALPFAIIMVLCGFIPSHPTHKSKTAAIVEADPLPPHPTVIVVPKRTTPHRASRTRRVTPRHHKLHINHSPQLTSGGVWATLRQCESGSDGLYLANTGNGFYGAYQFTKSSWAAVGGTGYPYNATPSEQDMRAKRLKDLQGWGAWPACSRKLGLR
jgi:hypothetical protein